MERVAKATGGAVQNTCSDLISQVLGKCGSFEEVQVGAERYNFFKECPEAKTATIVLRGGAEQFIEEVPGTLGRTETNTPSSIKTLMIVCTLSVAGPPLTARFDLHRAQSHETFVYCVSHERAAQFVSRCTRNFAFCRPGGGAIEMELSKILRAHSRTIAGKQQLVINAFAKALEVTALESAVCFQQVQTSNLHRMQRTGGSALDFSKCRI